MVSQKCQTLPAGGHFHVLQTWLLGVETGEEERRAIPKQKETSISWSPCHAGCENIKAVACEKNAGLQDFHLTFSVLHQYLFPSIPRSLVLKNTGQDKIGRSHY